MKLEIELVPKTCWNSNLRKAVSQAEWDTIRNRAYAEANHKCSICKGEFDLKIPNASPRRLECHEIWGYDDRQHVQKLVGFQALCQDCHHNKHIGFFAATCPRELLKELMEALIAHSLKVNGITEAEYKGYFTASKKLWQERSKHTWRIDLNGFVDKSIEDRLNRERNS
jgi:hypothetical protein